MIAIHTSAMKTALGATLLSFFLAGCAVGPTYHPPKDDLEPFHNKPSVLAAADSPQPPLDQWWTGFNDTGLVQVVQRALSQNLDLGASISRVQQARAAAKGAGAALLPTADLDASAAYERQSTRGALGSALAALPGYSRSLRDYNVGPVASWEVDLFGGLRRAAAAARAEAEAAEADQVGTRIMVAADAGDAYLQIRGYQARLGVAQQQISDDEHLLELVRDRHAAGAATGREMAQADALLKQAKASVPPLAIALEQQLNRLDVLMGVQPGTYAHDMAEVRDIPSVPAVPTHNEPTDMLRRRPDIIAAERRLAASNEQIGVALSDYYPKFSLSGALGFESSGSRLFSSQAFQPVGAGALRWRLFDFGRVDAEVAQAKGNHVQFLVAYRQAVLKAAENVEDSLTVLLQTQLRVNEVQDQVDALVKARDLSEQAYRAGSITLTDVLDADSQLLTARDEADASRADAARAAIGVYRALGGGWTPGPQFAQAVNLGRVQ